MPARKREITTVSIAVNHEKDEIHVASHNFFSDGTAEPLHSEELIDLLQAVVNQVSAKVIVKMEHAHAGN